MAEGVQDLGADQVKKLKERSLRRSGWSDWHRGAAGQDHFVCSQTVAPLMARQGNRQTSVKRCR
jgi:hypothetical protein